MTKNFESSKIKVQRPTLALVPQSIVIGERGRKQLAHPQTGHAHRVHHAVLVEDA